MSTFQNAERDAEDLAKLVNENTLVTTRYDANPKKSWNYLIDEKDAAFQVSLNGYQVQVDNAIDKIAEYAPRVVGDFTDGFEFTNFNEVGRYDDGLGNPDSVTYWSYNGALPFTVPPSTVPTSPTYNQRSVNDHSALINRNDVGAHDAGAIMYAENDDVENALRKRAGYYTLAEAQVADLEIGQYVVLTDYNNSLNEVVAAADAGGKYKTGLLNGYKLRLRHSGLFVSDKDIDNIEYNLSMIGGALRRTPASGSNQWEHIADSGHEPYGVTATVTDVDDYVFTINYESKAADNVKVGTVLMNLDYELAPYGIMTGANGGINSSTYQMYAPCNLYVDGRNSVSASPLWTSNNLGVTSPTTSKITVTHPPRALNVDAPMITNVDCQVGSGHNAQYRVSWGATQMTITAYDNIAGLIRYDGSQVTVSSSKNLNLTATASGGIITVTHDNVDGDWIPQLTPFGLASHRPVVTNVTATTVEVGFVDLAGNVVTAPDTNMQFYITRNGLVESAMDAGVRFGIDLGLCRVKNQDVGNISLNNFWYIGFNNVE